MLIPKSVLIALAIALSLGVAAYLASPLFAFHSLYSAAQSGDRDKIERLVDFQKVRASLKDQFSAKIVAAAQASQGDTQNPFAALGAMLIPAIADRAIDSFVTPDAISTMIKSGKAPTSDAPQAAAAGSEGPQLQYAYLDIDHFKITATNPSQPTAPVTLTMERHGLFNWQLIRIGLPLNAQPVPTQAAPAPPTPVPAGPASSASLGLPKTVGECDMTTVKGLSSRLDGDPTSGSAISYADGGYGVSYDIETGVQNAQVGDTVKLCLVELPTNCPAGDDRGKVYSATDLRTSQSWKLPDSEHECGGA